MNSTLEHTLLLSQAVRSSGGDAPAAPASTAETQAPASNGSAGAPAPGGMAQLMNMALPILLVVVVYLLIFRPQQKKEKERQASIQKLTKGDKVLTRGGIYGTIVGVRLDEELLILKIADNVKVELHTNAIDSVNPESPKQIAQNKAAGKKTK